jgi:hypothetical protein
MSISFAGGGGMLPFYRGGGRRAGVQEVAEAAERVQADTSLTADRQAGAGRAVEHPGRELKGSRVLGVDPADAHGLPLPRGPGQDVNVAAEPVVKAVLDAADIDQSGRVLASSITGAGRTKGWAIGR